ncbi:DUF159-domain-containing protein [Hypoxylon rubiginosum]|uniref:DUF159-domain-containing protein n=1 Tax=Hypoxylon rubiginosum TaxID=110542 RepID=A0ACC0DHN5_9PEZI|nr:DUF159-domain-containing protein [Hypoxylon rubiginosum]
MCGRYSLALRPAQVRQMLQDDDMSVDDAPDDEGDDAPRQSYNFAPGYHGLVYRAAVPDRGAGPRRGGGGASSSDDATAAAEEREDDGAPSSQKSSTSSSSRPVVGYKLQSMKWGLVPFWTKRNPDYGSVMKTINCRDDSLAQGGGMWSSMKARKRCVVVAQGFYEWLKKDGGRERLPHYVRRKDGRLMCFAGLWDMVQYENDEHKNYTYTIITTDSNAQLKFLHDRMPVILDNGSEGLRMWLDPKRYEWSAELQSLLKPFDGELEVYPVNKDVGKVGNNSPSFIIPIDSKENKSNIANFFAKGSSTAAAKKDVKDVKEEEEQPRVEVKKEEGFVAEDETNIKDESRTQTGIKREAEDEPIGGEPPKKMAITATNNKAVSPQKGGRSKISATSNRTKSPGKAKQPGTQKITKFFANSS